MFSGGKIEVTRSNKINKEDFMYVKRTREKLKSNI